MSKVFKLGITSDNNKKIQEVESINVLANKGIVGDRHFDDLVIVLLNNRQLPE